VIRSYLIASAIVVGLATSAHAQDAAAGEKEFLVCKACHQIGPGAKIAIGPVLNGVVGRKAGTFPGFEYSPANKDSGIVWTPEELDKSWPILRRSFPIPRWFSLVSRTIRSERMSSLICNSSTRMEQRKTDGSAT